MRSFGDGLLSIIVRGRIKEKVYKPQHLKTTYCAGIVFPQRRQMVLLMSYSWCKGGSCRFPEGSGRLNCKTGKVYGEEAIRRQHVAKWRHSFQSGRDNVENRNMTRSDRPSSSTTVISNTAQI
ncbi:hypothetical protein TNCV_2254821 [Trichonephila clavipes]|nr:hypothetical protein TNCV_2254821 [Trichonephila clavipes]